MEQISFIGEVKKVESKKLVSLDKSYRIIMESTQGQLLEIGLWPADENVKVTIERMPKGQ